MLFLYSLIVTFGFEKTQQLVQCDIRERQSVILGRISLSGSLSDSRFHQHLPDTEADGPIETRASLTYRDAQAANSTLSPDLRVSHLRSSRSTGVAQVQRHSVGRSQKVVSIEVLQEGSLILQAENSLKQRHSGEKLTEIKAFRKKQSRKQNRRYRLGGSGDRDSRRRLRVLLLLVLMPLVLVLVGTGLLARWLRHHL